MFCSACGHHVSESGRFCSSCGAEVPVHDPLPTVTAKIRATSIPAPTVAAPFTTNASPSDISRQAFWIWFVVLCGAGEVSALLTFPHGNMATNLGYGVGTAISALIIALVIALIRRAFTRNDFGRTVLQSWGIVLVLAIIGNYYSRPPLVPDHQAGLHAAALNLEEALTATQSPTPTAVSKDFGANETTSQSLARMFNQQAAVLRTYNVKIQKVIADENSLPLDSVLSPASLTSAQGIANGRRVVAHCISDIDQLQSLMESYFAEIRAIVDRVPTGTREQVLRGFEPANAATRQAFGDFLAAERKIISTTDAVLDLAEGNLGVSYAKDGQIYLPAAALVQYQGLMKQLIDDVAQETHAQKVVTETAQKSQERLKTFASDTENKK